MNQDRETWSMDEDRAEQEEIDKKEQDFPDVGEIHLNTQKLWFTKKYAVFSHI